MVSSKEEHWHLRVMPTPPPFKIQSERLYEKVQKRKFKTEEKALVFQRKNQGIYEDIEKMQTWQFTHTHKQNYPYDVDESKICDICHPPKE